MDVLSATQKSFEGDLIRLRKLEGIVKRLLSYGRYPHTDVSTQLS